VEIQHQELIIKINIQFHNQLLQDLEYHQHLVIYLNYKQLVVIVP
jgi:hypothetical protein